MVSMLTIFLNKNYGIVNQLAGALGAERVAYLDSAEPKVAQYWIPRTRKLPGWLIRM